MEPLWECDIWLPHPGRYDAGLPHFGPIGGDVDVACAWSSHAVSVDNRLRIFRLFKSVFVDLALMMLNWFI